MIQTDKIDYFFPVRTACTDTPCLNGGECTVSGDSFTCNCPEGYTGDTCEQSKRVKITQ